MEEQAKFTYCLLGKAFEQQTKTTEGQGEKQIKVIKYNKKGLYKKHLIMVI